MTLSKILDTYYYYDILEGRDVAINPQNFIVFGYGRSIHSPAGTKPRYELETDPDKLYEVGRRIIEDLGGLRKYQGNPHLFIPTGRLPKRNISGITHMVEIESFLIDLLRREGTTRAARQIIAKELMEDVLRKIQPTNLNYFRDQRTNIQRDQDDNEDNDNYGDDYGDYREPWQPEDYDPSGESWMFGTKDTDEEESNDTYFNNLGKNTSNHFNSDKERQYPNDDNDQEWDPYLNPDDDE